MIQNSFAVRVGGADGEAWSGPRRRQHSDIEVAGYSLDAAIDTVALVQATGKQHATMEELHLAIDPTLNENTLRTRIYNGMKYRLLAFSLDRLTGRKEVVLTDLGRRILNSETERQARVEAYLSVEVHREVYRLFKDRMLPDDVEFERVLVNELGVSAGQVDNIRRVVKKSAAQAGFFEQGRDRLVMPSDISLMATGVPSEAPESETPHVKEHHVVDPPAREDTVISPPVSPSVHPLLDYLWAELIRDSATWTPEARNEWFATFERNFRYVYRDRT